MIAEYMDGLVCGSVKGQKDVIPANAGIYASINKCVSVNTGFPPSRE